MINQIARFAAVAVAAVAFTLSAVWLTSANEQDGVIQVKSDYSMRETIDRLKQDVADKGIMFFDEVHQAQLAADAGIDLHPSTLLIFGNPPLGTQFMTSNPVSGLDWPVRLLIYEDANGAVWAAYTDFAWIARRHHITDRTQQFEMASMVIASITSVIAAD
jgi:uncharacterized protein (DUF302 family)